MKHVFKNHSEVCHIWAQQTQEEGRASRIFFDGPSIFSYGRHFEMARFITPEVVFITTRGYSVSTAKHLKYVQTAVSHETVFTVPSFDDHNENVKHYISLVYELAGKAARSRKNAEWIIQDIDRNVRALESYLRIFEKNISDDSRGAAGATLKEIAGRDFSAIAKRQAAAAKLEREKRAREIAERLEKWKRGEYHGAIHDGPMALRLHDGEIQTSLGARVPIKEAVDLFLDITNGRPVHGRSIGRYTVTGFDGEILTVGCHRIPMTEMERMYRVLRIGHNLSIAEVK